jgi:hypothetical protein
MSVCYTGAPLALACYTVTRPLPRRYVPVRLSPTALAEVDDIAAREHDGNRSAALRLLLRLGFAAYRAGKR